MMKKIKHPLPLVLVTLGVVTVLFTLPQIIKMEKITNESGLRNFAEEELRQFDGTNENQPIYLAMEGKVYDVSMGREFYSLDGPYHYLAGKGSTEELSKFGGEIVKRKYRVIGKLTK